MHAVSYLSLLLLLLIYSRLSFSAGCYSALITIQRIWIVLGSCLFYNSKNLNCIGALSFFTIQRIWIVLGRYLYDSTRSIGEVLFLNQFYSSDFWSGKLSAWKNFEWFWSWVKVKSEAKKMLFSYRCFWESEKLRCEKIFSKRRNFFVHVRLLKEFFWQLLMIMRFDYFLVLVLGLVW